MSLKNIQLINAEEVSNLFRTKYDKESFIKVLLGEEKNDLATATTFTNELIKGDSIEIMNTESYIIELTAFSDDVILELRDLAWGLVLFINEQAHYLRVNRLAQESEFEAIKNYPTLKIVDFGSGENEAIKNLDCLAHVKQLHTLILDNCPALIDLGVLNQLTSLETLYLDGFSIDSELHNLASVKSLRVFSQNESEIKDINHLKGFKKLNKLFLFSCKSLVSLEGISSLSNLTSLNLSSCESLTSLEAISGLTNLNSLNLDSCESLISLEGISSLSNLTTLDLSGCKSLTSLEGISRLTNLTSLDLTSCYSLMNVDGLSDLSNLTTLNLMSCSYLTNLEVISGLSNLTKLNLRNCYTLTNLEGISGLINLASLDLRGCESLTSLEGISGLSNLTTLDLSDCESLINLEGISDLINLTTLGLSRCQSLKNLEIISSLSNLTTLDLSDCESLTSLEGISGLSNLTTLDLSDCESLINLEGISGLTNLASLNLSSCQCLPNLDVISALTNLASLDLFRCKSLIFIKKLKSLTQLSKLELRDCGNIRDFEELINCPNLKEVSWIHKASCSYVLTGSAVRRKDQLFIEEKMEGWINDLQFAKNPIAFANELIAAVSLIKNETLTKEQFIHLAKVMRVRGLADGDSGNAFSVTTWELWVEAVMKQSDAFQEILEKITQNIDAERELEVFVAPILTALADISILYPSAKVWAINFVKELVAPFKENEDWARTIAPATAVFYAGMELQEEVTFWLNKGTHPHIPKWKDTILLALATYYVQKKVYGIARNYLKNITLPDVQDQGRVLLANAMCIDFPQEALEEFIAINDVVLQTTLAKQFALEPAILASSEGLYQILLCLEQTPALFSEFVSNVLEKQPSSQFVQSIEALFAKPTEKSSSATAFLSLCNEPTVIENIGKLSLEAFKNELQEEVNKERIPLVEDFVSTLIEKELINEKFREKFQYDLITNLK